MKKLASLLLLAFLSLNMVAQEKLSEGVITMKQNMSSPNSELNAQLALMGFMTTTTYFKDGNTRSETSSPMMGDMTVIANQEAKKVMTLMNNPQAGGKVYTTADINPSEEDLKDVAVEKTTETKTVLGYECTKYIATLKKDGADATMEIYATDKLSAVNNQTVALGDKFSGFPMYMVINMNQNGMEFVITSEVTEIKKETVSKDKFDMAPPEGYKEMQMPAGY